MYTLILMSKRNCALCCPWSFIFMLAPNWKTGIWNFLKAKWTLQKSRSLKTSMSRPNGSQSPSDTQLWFSDFLKTFITFICICFVFSTCSLFFHVPPFSSLTPFGFLDAFLLCFLIKLYFPLSFGCFHLPSLPRSIISPLSPVFIFLILPRVSLWAKSWGGKIPLKGSVWIVDA